MWIGPVVHTITRPVLKVLRRLRLKLKLRNAHLGHWRARHMEVRGNQWHKVVVQRFGLMWLKELIFSDQRCPAKQKIQEALARQSHRLRCFPL